jgi:hypothetical protein
MHEMLFQGANFKTIPIANSSLRYSAHTFGDSILYPAWGRARREWALWQFCPTLTEESLKNVLF